MARLLKTPRFHKYSIVHDWDARVQWEGFQFKVLMKEHDKAVEQGKIVDRILQWPIADGYAYYLVTKEKPLTLQWINVGDCWTMPAFAIRGLRVEDL